MVAKYAEHPMAALLPQIGLIVHRWRDIVSQGTAEDSVIAGKPMEAGLGGEMERLVGDRPLGGPQACRVKADPVLHVGACCLELMTRVLRVAETAWQRNVRMRNLRDLCVANQREDRVIKRRGRNFDLPAARKLAIDRDDFTCH